MKKRNLLVAAMSLCLVAIIAVGGTLAYFTDQSNTVTNTFTSGKVDIVLWEATSSSSDGDPEVLDPTTIAGVDDRTYTGINFTNILPGDRLYKSPTVSLSPDSVNSYVAMRLWVEGVDDAVLSDEDEALAMQLLEDSLKRISTTCGKTIPATAANNDFTEPTTNTPAWKAFRLEDGSILLVASGSKQSLVDINGDGIKESVTAPRNQVPPGMNLTAFDAIYVGTSSTGGVDASKYGNELAGLAFELKAEAFAIQADNLPTKYGRDTVTGWEWFAHTVVDTCNGDVASVFESYNADAPFNNK